MGGVRARGDGAVTALAAVALLLAALLYAPSARADGPSFEDYFGLGGAYVAPHDLHVGSPPPVGARGIDNGTLRLNSATFFTGAGFGFGVATKHLVFPILSFDLYFATGLYDEQRTSIDGSIAHLRPWTDSLFDFGIGGIGYRWNDRRWAFAVTGRFGLIDENMGADAAYGAKTYELSPGSITPYVRVDLEVCRRLDPFERLCLVASPNVYAYDQTFHGGILSFRYERGK